MKFIQILISCIVSSTILAVQRRNSNYKIYIILDYHSQIESPHVKGHSKYVNYMNLMEKETKVDMNEHYYNPINSAAVIDNKDINNSNDYELEGGYEFIEKQINSLESKNKELKSKKAHLNKKANNLLKNTSAFLK